MTAPRAREHANPPSPPDRLPPRRGGGSSPSPYICAASAAGWPAGPARPPVARRGLVRSARALSAAACLLLVGALAQPATAQEEEISLVSNLEESGGVSLVNVYPIGFTLAGVTFAEQRIAQQFTTGSNSGGYTLKSVVLNLMAVSTSGAVVNVGIHEDSSGQPGNLLTVLDNPADPFGNNSTAAGNRTFSASPPLSLDPSTKYWVVMSDVNSDPGLDNYDVRVTSSRNETSTQGFTIRNSRHVGKPGSWSENTGTFVKLEVRGTVIPPGLDATLSALSVTGGGSELVTNFASGTTSYTASVANGVEEVTVTLTKGHASATVEYLLGDDGNEDDLEDADDMEAGFQVPLAVGANRIVVGVTAEDGTTTQDYVVTVTRAAAGMTPTPTCTLDTAAGDIWCSVITVGENNGYYGYNSFNSQGELSSDSFMVGTSRYTIDTLSVAGSSKEDAGNLTLDLNEFPNAAEQAALERLVLHLDDDAFRLIDRNPGPPGFFYWEDSDLDWSGENYVIARLREIPIPPGLEVTLDLSEDRPFEDTGQVTVTAMASPATPVAFTVEISASPVAPATGDDFELSANRTLSFAANETESTGTVTISPVVDEDPEPHDVVTVSGAVSNPAISDPDDVTLTILNDDSEDFDVAVSAPKAVDEDAGTATVTVTLTTGQNSVPVIDVELRYHWREEETATRNEDYRPPSGQVLGSLVVLEPVPPSAFSSNAEGTAWVAQRSFTIGIVDDTEAERAETIVFQVGTPANSSPKRTIRIRDNDTPVMRNVTLVSGPGPDEVWSAGEQVELEVRYTLPVVVEQQPSSYYECWAYNADGTCKPPGPYVAVAFRSDARPGYGEVLGVARVQYASGSGTATLHFAYTVGTAEAGARGVEVVDGKVLLRGATIRPPEGGDDKLDDELSEFTRTRVTRVTVRKPGGGAWTAGNKVQVEVTFAGPVQQGNRDKVDVNDREGTPTIGLLLGDPQNRPLARTASYEGGSGSNSLEFEYRVTAGDGRISAVEVVADSLARNGATIRNKEGYDAELDHLGVLRSSSLALSVRDTAAPEGGTLRFTMELAQASKAPVTVDYETADGTATAGQDYTAKRGTVTFAPGRTRKTVAVPVLRDEAAEDAETVVLRLSNVRAEGSEEPVEVTDPEAEGTIEDGASEGLTASFEGLPETHDGERAFRFRVAFSEPIGISYRSLREDAFEVTGGRVTRGRRVDDRRDLFEMTVEPDGAGEVTITLPAGRECSVSGAICTKGENRRQLTNTPTATVAGPPVVPLTASFVGVPAEHDGERAFTLRIAFSERVGWMNGRRLREHVVAVAGGRATKAGRVNRRRDLWKLTVEPDSLAAVTVTLAAGAACRTPAAVCTSDGRALSHTIATTVRGPVTVSVADARAEEGTDATLDFAVTLSRAASGAVAVAYATADGTATAGADYTARKGQLTFAPGETETTVRVPVLDDAHDEGEETLTLRLSAASGAVLADGTATGTIVNSDKLQQAWLARFGRTVATHVTDAVGDRLRGTPGQDSHLTVGGYRLPLGQRGATDGADDGVSGVERLVLALGQRLGLGTGPAPAGAGGWPDATDPRLGQSRTLDVGSALNLRQVLLGSSFRLALGGDAVGARNLRLTAWGRVAGTTFDGQDGPLSLNGDVLTGTVGVDGEWDRLLAGLAVAHSRGDGSYTNATPDMGARGRGDLEQTLTSVHPYLRYAVNDRLAVWGLLGFGTGQMEMEVDTDEIREADTDLLMGAFGGRGILLAAPESGGFQLATRTDAMLTRTTSDAVVGMASGDAEAHRLRVVLEGSRGFTWAEGRRLTPTMEVGLRHDWGDAETGFGLELGGRVQYADPALGLTIDATVRGLLAHEDSDYQEWGASGTVRVAPGAGGHGLSLTLAPAWGATASGVDGLWSRQTTAGLAPQGTRQTQAGRLNAEVGYGFAPFGTGLLTPYAGTVLSDGAARTYRVGGRLQMRGGACRTWKACGKNGANSRSTRATGA